ncbi:multidrug ABC transporter ATPase [Microbacterium sp. YY-01]|uniref:multidrug ABC transporter ATPase n=1 Tax=Microbacterium sp. YY-01 TaxID=3421634 RepID=UPI003D16A512
MSRSRKPAHKPGSPGTSATPEVPVKRIDRYLAYAALILAAAAIICFFAIIFGTAFGMQQQDFAHGVWPIVAAIPLWGLPLSMVCIFTLLISSLVRKNRAAKRS